MTICCDDSTHQGEVGVPVTEGAGGADYLQGWGAADLAVVFQNQDVFWVPGMIERRGAETGVVQGGHWSPGVLHRDQDWELLQVSVRINHC